MNYLGNVSYPLYLCHYSMLVLIGAAIPVRAALTPLLYVASVVAAVIIYHCVDAPLRRYGYAQIGQCVSA
jgi:peptidoglycan/LPS O-acetylase OafA/YrhL